jgi:hypothetical protein
MMTEREYVADVVKHLTRALEANVSRAYASGYLQATIVSTIMDLPPKERDFHIRCLLLELSLEDEEKVPAYDR